MHIEELGEECAGEGHGERSISGTGGERVVFVNAKRAAMGVGARILFYPTLVYNVLCNMIEPQFHWWDQIDEFLLLGAVPFPSDVPRLKKLGVGGVITLNEPYETLNKVVAKQRPQTLDALFANMKEEDEVYEPEDESWNQHKSTLQQGSNGKEQGHVVVLVAILATLSIEDILLRGAQVPMQNAIFSIQFGLQSHDKSFTRKSMMTLCLLFFPIVLLVL